MGSYCTLYVADQNLGSVKNDIDPSVMLLFRSTDRLETILVPGTPEYLEYFTMPAPGDDWEPRDHVQVLYRTSCATVRDRLDLLGFTLEVSTKAFSLAVARERSLLDEHVAARHGEVFVERARVYASLTAEEWLQAVSTILAHDLGTLAHDSEEFAVLSPLVRTILEGGHDHWMGCPVHDVRHVIRLFLEIAPPDDPVTLDLTDLVAGGWLDNADDMISEAEEMLSGEAATAQRVIVLTEGVSDKRILETALSLLAPHLADYFTFMDFEGAKVAGGSGALAHTLKAFVGAGIINRVIAVFDNDTAAAEALTSLESITLPSNFAVIQYPALDLLNAYPTLGPTGIVAANVNGVAASIELYLGEDVLRSPDGQLTPVQWKGYNERLGRYQGVILDKSRVAARFEDKVRRCRDDPHLIASTDWSGLGAIVAEISRAAARTSAREVLALEELDF